MFIIFLIYIAVTIVVTASTTVVLPLNVPRTIEGSQWMRVWASTVVLMGRFEASWWKSTVWLFLHATCALLRAYLESFSDYISEAL